MNEFIETQTATITAQVVDITSLPVTSDKETYLAWRAAWKAEYKNLSTNIRKAKLEFKEANRAYSHGTGTYSSMVKLQSHVMHLKREARDMILLRWASKSQAGANFLKSKGGE